MGFLPLYVPSDPPLYKFARALLVTCARLYGRYSVGGADNLPVTGPAIVVSNHHSDIDPIILGIGVPRTLHFMADAVQFRRAFVGRCIKRLAAFPIAKGQADLESMRTALRLLEAGEVVTLFPEGDMFADGRFRPFGRGVGFLALRSGAPVVPAAINGAVGVPDRRWLRRPPVRLTVGEPLDLSDIAGQGRAAYAEAAARVEAAVRALHDGVRERTAEPARRSATG